MVSEISDVNFETEVSKSALPVVVDFWAPWCGPCRALGPVIEKVSESYKGQVKFCKLNVDENRTIAGKFGVRSIPTVIYFKNGSPRFTTVGSVPEKDFKAKVEALIGA